MKFHVWEKYPTESELKAHINLFIIALSQGKFKDAFTLCPAKTWKQPEFADPSDMQFLNDFIDHAVFEAVDGQEILDDEHYNKNKPETWVKFITPPNQVNFQDFNLNIPEEGEGEVLANVHLKGEVTDITGRYDLVTRDGKWLLAFSQFEVM